MYPRTELGFDKTSILQIQTGYGVFTQTEAVSSTQNLNNCVTVVTSMNLYPWKGSIWPVAGLRIGVG